MAKPRSEATRIFGERMRAVRLQIGISQMDLGELTGIHFTNIAKIERGEANPSLFTIIRIAGALEIDSASLVEGLGVDKIPDSENQMRASDFVQERLRRRREAEG